LGSETKHQSRFRSSKSFRRSTRVQKVIAAGLLLKNGKVPVKAATAWLKANVNPMRENYWNSAGGDTTLNELREHWCMWR
jgi:hypothetical protein